MCKLDVGFECIKAEGRREIGPYIFLERLARSYGYDSPIRPVSSWRLDYDLGLFCNTRKRRLINKPFVLRCGGVYIDKLNTIGDTCDMNNGIFRSMDQAAGIIFNSQYNHDATLSLKGSIEAPTRVILGAVPLDLFDPEGPNRRKELGIGEEAVVFVASAKWRRHKRLKETLELFERFQARHSGQCRLIVLGRVGEAIVGRDGVEFVGHVSNNELGSWYRTGDIFLQLAWVEPGGNTQLEAMACGLPTICMNNGGISESVVKFNGGVVCKADEPTAFKMVDYYNPPAPNYERILDSIEEVLDNKKEFPERIDREDLGIERAAQEYEEFFINIAEQVKNTSQNFG
jgi:glycosyltransferase involved in cell wall biosynthesis